jgi:hypothetical protein
VLSVHAGHEPSSPTEIATLIIADAITLDRLNGIKQKLIANLVDPVERGYKGTSSRTHDVVKAAKAALGPIDQLDIDSVRSFLASPMRADIPRVSRAAKKPLENINLRVADAVTLPESGECEGSALALGERYAKTDLIAGTATKLSGVSQREAFALGLGPDEQYVKSSRGFSKLRALAWSHTTKAVQEAVLSVHAGHEPCDLQENATLTIADAITLRQLGGKMEDYIAKQVDPDERSMRPNATKARIQ